MDSQHGLGMENPYHTQACIFIFSVMESHVELSLSWYSITRGPQALPFLSSMISGPFAIEMNEIPTIMSIWWHKILLSTLFECGTCTLWKRGLGCVDAAHTSPLFAQKRMIVWRSILFGNSHENPCLTISNKHRKAPCQESPDSWQNRGPDSPQSRHLRQCCLKDIHGLLRNHTGNHAKLRPACLPCSFSGRSHRML